MSKHCQYMSKDDSIDCSFNHTDVYQIFSVPLGALLDHVVVDVTIGVGSQYGNNISLYSNFYALLSDGINAVGFWIIAKVFYDVREPCNFVQLSLADFEGKYFNYGKTISSENPYPQVYKLLFSTAQKSAACLHNLHSN